MSDEMLAAIDLLTLELGYVTDGEGEPIEDEAIIHFREDGTCEIRISSPGAHTIAAKIVETWNARTGGVAQIKREPISQDAATIAQTAHVIINRLTEENERLRIAQSETDRSWDMKLADRVQQLADAGCKSLTCIQILGLIAFVRDGEGDAPVPSTHQGAPLRHHANETLEEQEFLLKQSSVPSTDGASHD